MGYKRADEILPDDILKVLQQYVSGEAIYVPKATEVKRRWGTCTGTIERLHQRNQEMYAEHESGVSVKELAQRYYLTEKSVRRILRNIRTEPPREKDEFYLGGQTIE